MISSLESELGFALLRRGRAGAATTADGERVLPAIRGILASRERLEQTASAIRGLDRGTVRIGTFTSVGVHWLPGIIADFQADYPGVELKLMSGDYHDVEQWLSDGSADIGFVSLPTKLAGETAALAADRLLAVVPASHPLAGAERFPVAELAREPFIGLLETSDRDARGVFEAVGGRRAREIHHQGRLRRHRHGRARARREHNARAPAQELLRGRPLPRARPARCAHDRPVSPRRGQGRARHEALRRVREGVGQGES